MTRASNIVKEPSGRPTRTPVGKRNILSVKGKEAGYEYRIVNDEFDRIDAFKEAGWEVVSNSDVQIGDKRVGQANTPGTAAQMSVGQGTKGVVMRIRSDWYDEDQKAKRAQVHELEATTRKDARNGADYGDLKYQDK